MALNAYIAQVQSLLDDFGAVEYTVANLTGYINDARVQIALSSESIRQSAQLVLTAGQQNYNFSDITFVAAPSPPAGLAGVGAVRGARLQLGNGGYKRLQTRAWEWFNMFFLSVAAPTSGPPTIFARLQSGVLGTLWVAPFPDAAYTLAIDAVAYPINLVDDTTPEALQYPWTETYTTARYLDLLDTYSDHATLAPDRRVPLYQGIAEAIERRGGAIDVRYVSMAFMARRAP